MLVESECMLPPLPFEDPSVAAERIGAEIEDWTIQHRQGKKMPKYLIQHTTLSFHPDDQVDATMANQISREVVDMVMPGERPVLYATHGDTDHLHTHIELATVDSKGRVWNPHHDFRLWEAAVEEMEIKYGLHRVKVRIAMAQDDSTRSPLKKSPTGKELQQAVRLGIPSIRMQMQAILDESLSECSTMTELALLLERYGMQCIPNVSSTGRISGMSYSLDGEVMKGSDLGKKYTWSGLQKHCGVSYEQNRDDESLGVAVSQGSFRNSANHDGVARDSGKPVAAYTGSQRTRAAAWDDPNVERKFAENDVKYRASGESFAGNSPDSAEISRNDNPAHSSASDEKHFQRDQVDGGISKDGKDRLEGISRNPSQFIGEDRKDNRTGEQGEKSAGTNGATVGGFGTELFQPNAAASTDGCMQSDSGIYMRGIDHAKDNGKASTCSSGMGNYLHESPEWKVLSEHDGSDNPSELNQYDPFPYLRQRGFEISCQGDDCWNAQIDGDTYFQLSRSASGRWSWRNSLVGNEGQLIDLVREVEGIELLGESTYRLLAAASSLNVNPIELPKPTIQESLNNTCLKKAREYLLTCGLEKEAIHDAEKSGLLSYGMNDLLWLGRDEDQQLRSILRQPYGDAQSEQLSLSFLPHSDPRFPPIIIGSQSKLVIVEDGITGMVAHADYPSPKNEPPTILISGNRVLVGWMHRLKEWLGRFTNIIVGFASNDVEAALQKQNLIDICGIPSSHIKLQAIGVKKENLLDSTMPGKDSDRPRA